MILLYILEYVFTESHNSSGKTVTVFISQIITRITPWKSNVFHPCWYTQPCFVFWSWLKGMLSLTIKWIHGFLSLIFYRYIQISHPYTHYLISKKYWGLHQHVSKLMCTWSVGKIMAYLTMNRLRTIHLTETRNVLDQLWRECSRRIGSYWVVELK